MVFVPAPRKFGDEMRQRAGRMVREARAHEPGLSVNPPGPPQRNPSHKMLMSVLGGMSESEHQHVQARVRAAMDTHAVNEGRHQGGRTPYGYEVVRRRAYLLREMVHCGACGRRMQGEGVRKATYYRCNART